MLSQRLANFVLLPELILKNIVVINRGNADYYCEKVSAFEVCPRCAEKCETIYDHRTVSVKDSPLRGNNVILKIRKRRFLCKKCQKPFMEPVPGISKYSRTTARYKRDILWASENFSDLSKVKKAYRCSTGYLYKTVYSMLELRRRQRLYQWPTTIGLDEHSFKRYKNRGIHYVSAVVDFNGKRLYELIDGKSADEMKASLSHIEGRHNVRNVVMDLSETYRSFSRQFFGREARVIADKFHVLRLFSKALSRKRIDIIGDKRKHPIRSLLLRNNEDLESHERSALWQWLGEHPDVRDLYQYKEAMRRLYRIKGSKRAKRAFAKLLDHMGQSKQEAVQKLRQTLVNWRTEILNYFESGLTNARTEGFNNKAKVLQHKAYGYKSFRNYRLRLLNYCA